jgi:hypothetical protein
LLELLKELCALGALAVPPVVSHAVSVTVNIVPIIANDMTPNHEATLVSGVLSLRDIVLVAIDNGRSLAEWPCMNTISQAACCQIEQKLDVRIITRF